MTVPTWFHDALRDLEARAGVARRSAGQYTKRAPARVGGPFHATPAPGTQELAERFVGRAQAFYEAMAIVREARSKACEELTSAEVRGDWLDGQLRELPRVPANEPERWEIELVHLSTRSVLVAVDSPERHRCACGVLPFHAYYHDRLWQCFDCLDLAVRLLPDSAQLSDALAAKKRLQGEALNGPLFALVPFEALVDRDAAYFWQGVSAGMAAVFEDIAEKAQDGEVMVAPAVIGLLRIGAETLRGWAAEAFL